jgi:hypothetical protein
MHANLTADRAMHARQQKVRSAIHCAMALSVWCALFHFHAQEGHLSKDYIFTDRVSQGPSAAHPFNMTHTIARLKLTLKKEMKSPRHRPHRANSGTLTPYPTSISACCQIKKTASCPGTFQTKVSNLIAQVVWDHVQSQKPAYGTWHHPRKSECPRRLPSQPPPRQVQLTNHSLVSRKVAELVRKIQVHHGGDCLLASN